VLAQGGSPTGVAAAREGIAALRSYAWLVVLLAVAGVLAGYLLGGPADGSKYRAWITAHPLGANAAVTKLGISTPDGPQAADFLGDGIVRRIEAATGRSYDEVFEHLKLEQPPNGGPNPPIALIAKAGTEAEAKTLLGTWMVAIRQARLRYVHGVLDRGERGLRKSLGRAAARREPDTAAAIVELLARTQALRSTLAVDYASLRTPRSVTTETVSRPRAAVIGGGAGLIAGLALALLFSLVGGRLRTAEGVAAAVGTELLADARSPGRVPSPEHAREVLRSTSAEAIPALLPAVACGEVSPQAVEAASAALGEGIEVHLTVSIGDAGFLETLEKAGAWAIVATPGSVRRAEVTALRSELAGTGLVPAGLIVV